MIKIETLIQLPKTEDFVPFSEEMFHQLDTSQFRLEYLQGAISIIYWGEELLGHMYTDDIISLWAYIINGLEDYLNKGKTEIYSSGTVLTMTRLPQKQLLFAVNNKKFTLPETDFLELLLAEAIRFFGILGQVREAAEAKKLIGCLDQLS